MTVTVTEIDLTQWEDDALRDDIRRCMHALGMLTEGSPAHAGLTRAITGSVAELQRRSPAGPEQADAMLCQCGEVFTTADDATAHFFAVFIPANNVGNDGRIHQEIQVPGTQPVTLECPVPGPDHGAVPCEDGCREVRM
jgi:hypothetical protein